MLFRKKVPYVEYWVGLVGDTLADKDAEADIFVILFPEVRKKSSPVSRHEYLAEKNISTHDFLYFKRCISVGSAAALAFWSDQRQFHYFSGVGVHDALRSDCGKYGLDVYKFIQRLSDKIKLGVSSSFVSGLEMGSTTYGRRETMKSPQSEIFDTSTLVFGWIVEHLNDKKSNLFNCIESDIATSRDSFINFNSYMVRMHNFYSKKIRIV